MHNLRFTLALHWPEDGKRLPFKFLILHSQLLSLSIAPMRKRAIQIFSINGADVTVAKLHPTALLQPSASNTLYKSCLNISDLSRKSSTSFALFCVLLAFSYLDGERHLSFRWHIFKSFILSELLRRSLPNWPKRWCVYITERLKAVEFTNRKEHSMPSTSNHLYHQPTTLQLEATRMKWQLSPR
jgi:hypothetical protein